MIIQRFNLRDKTELNLEHEILLHCSIVLEHRRIGSYTIYGEFQFSSDEMVSDGKLTADVGRRFAYGQHPFDHVIQYALCDRLDVPSLNDGRELLAISAAQQDMSQNRYRHLQ